MKKAFLYLLLTAFAAMGFAACDDDNDNADHTPRVIGTYSGSFIVQLPDTTTEDEDDWMAIGIVNDDIVVEGVSKNIVSVTLEDFSFPNPAVDGALIPIGTIKVENIAVVRVADVYVLAGGGRIDLTESGLGTGNVIVEGLIESDGKCDMTIQIELGEGASALAVRVLFSTDKAGWR